MKPFAQRTLFAAAVVALSLTTARSARADDPKDFGSWFLVKSADHGDFCMDASLDAGKKLKEKTSRLRKMT